MCNRHLRSIGYRSDAWAISNFEHGSVDIDRYGDIRYRREHDNRDIRDGNQYWNWNFRDEHPWFDWWTPMIKGEEANLQKEIQESLRRFLEEYRESANSFGIPLETMLAVALLRETKIHNDLIIQLINVNDALVKETHQLHEAIWPSKRH